MTTLRKLFRFQVRLKAEATLIYINRRNTRGGKPMTVAILLKVADCLHEP